MATLLPTVFLLMAVAVTLTQGNDQDWSRQAVEGKDFAIDCMPTNLRREPYVNPGDTLTWYKKDKMDTPISSDAHHHLQDKDGVTDAELVFTPVTEQSAGVYLCYVSNGTDDLGFVLKGLNVGGPLYEDNIDKYRTPVITGVIAGGAVCFLVCAVCFIDRFRFLTDEQKQKKRDRKAELMAKQERIRSNGKDNLGMDLSDDVNKGSPYEHVNGEQTMERNTHL